MTTLFDTTIEDLRNGDIKIFTKTRTTKAYRRGLRNMKAKSVTFHYAQYKDSKPYQINRKILKQYEEILNS